MANAITAPYVAATSFFYHKNRRIARGLCLCYPRATLGMHLRRRITYFLKMSVLVMFINLKAVPGSL
jgi:hypothetical protein